ncbi:unnamed protein product [Ectocarpus sp. CCAP 1310/34]|nr:unnamed protein product [Ectocarpus sp. CCAP 1310/34]
MQTPKNMNMQAEQSVAGTTGSTPAPSTAASATASTVAAQAPQQMTFFGPAHSSSTREAPPAGTLAPAAAVDLTAAEGAGAATGANMTASASPQQQPVAGLMSAARSSTEADESTRSSQASQLVDVVDEEPTTSAGTEERSNGRGGRGAHHFRWDGRKIQTAPADWRQQSTEHVASMDSMGYNNALHHLEGTGSKFAKETRVRLRELEAKKESKSPTAHRHPRRHLTEPGGGEAVYAKFLKWASYESFKERPSDNFTDPGRTLFLSTRCKCLVLPAMEQCACKIHSQQVLYIEALANVDMTSHGECGCR